MTSTSGLSVLAVSPVAEAGGAETLLLDVLAGLQGAGVTVALVVLGSGPLHESAERRGVATFRGPPLSFRSSRSVLGALLAVRRAVVSVHPDVVLSSHPKGQIVSRLAAAGRRSVTHVTQLYDPPSRTSVSTMVASCMPGTRLSISEETAAAYRALRRTLDPIVIPPGTDGTRLREDARSGDGNRAWADAGLDGAGPKVVMIGRLQRFKGPFDVLAAAALLTGPRPDARFLIVGPDSPIEPDLRRELRTAIADMDLGSTVALAGRLSAQDLAATVAGATLVIHPAHREPFGLAVVEALTLGTPVVSYATVGPAAILATGGGAIVPVGDVEALAAALLRALDDPATLARWAASAGPTARRFDIVTTVARYCDVLERAARLRTGSRRRTVASIGVGPLVASGVRDYGRLLDDELESRGLSVERHWLENAGDRLSPAVRISAQLLAVGLSRPRPHSAVWHYSPVAYGFRGVPGVGVLVGGLLRARGCRVVTVLHELAYTYRPGVDPPRARVKAVLQRLALRAVLAGSSEVVVTTERRRAALRAQGADPAGRIRVIPVFPTIPDPGRSSGVPHTDAAFVIGVPGYAGDGVRPDLVLGAVASLGATTSVRVVLLGAPGPDSDDGRRWLRLAADHGVLRCVEFTGVVEAAELSRRLAESTVVVLPNEEGPSSRKTTLAVALAHGLPVVSLDGYNRWDELVESAAIRVVPNDAATLGAALTELRDSPLDREDLGGAAARFAAAHMSLASAADTFVELLGGMSEAQPVTAAASVSAAVGSGRSSQPSSSHGSGAMA